MATHLMRAEPSEAQTPLAERRADRIPRRCYPIVARRPLLFNAPVVHRLSKATIGAIFSRVI
jgi:hypothetical protein